MITFLRSPIFLRKEELIAASLRSRSPTKVVERPMFSPRHGLISVLAPIRKILRKLVIAS